RQPPPRPGWLQALARVRQHDPLPEQEREVRPDGGEVAPDGRGLEALVLEVIDELPQIAGRHFAGATDPARREELGEARDVAAVRLQRARREAALEGEVVEELRDVERGAQPRCRRVFHHQTTMRVTRIAAIQSSTALVRSNVSRIACQLRPTAAPRWTRRPYHMAEAQASGRRTRPGRTRLMPAKTGTMARSAGRNRLRKIACVPQRA